MTDLDPRVRDAAARASPDANRPDDLTALARHLDPDETVLYLFAAQLGESRLPGIVAVTLTRVWAVRAETPGNAFLFFPLAETKLVTTSLGVGAHCDVLARDHTNKAMKIARLKKQEAKELAQIITALIATGGDVPLPAPLSWRDDKRWLEWEAPLNILVEGHYQDTLWRLVGHGSGVLIPVDVTLQREPDNQYDPNAMKALVKGIHVGYLRRDIAEIVAPKFDAAGRQEATFCGVIRGGWQDYSGWDDTYDAWDDDFAEEQKMLGVHVWAGRPLTPFVDFRALVEEAPGVWKVEWPPSPREVATAKPRLASDW